MRISIMLGACAIFVAGMAPALAFDGLVFDVNGDDEITESLRQSSLLAAAEAEGVTDPTELLSAARADYGRLVGTLYSTGRYGGVINIAVNGVEAADISPLDRIGSIQSIRVSVQPGPVYDFSRADIGPIPVPGVVPTEYAVGQPARSGVIRDAAGAAVDAWRQAGHAKADIGGQSVIAQHDQDTLAAAVEVAPGPLVRFGNIRFSGSKDVREERLRDIAGFPRGEVFDPDELDSVNRRLRRTQVFSAVALVEAETLGPGDTLDVDTTLTAFPPRRIGFGAEISTVEGLTLSSYWIHRNLFGGAERLRLEGDISGIGGGTGGMDYSLAARFERPATFSPENTFFAEIGIARLEEDDFISNTGGLSFGIQRYVNEQIEISYGLGYRFSRVEDASGTTDFSMFTVPLSVEYDSREQPLNAKQGIFADITLTPFLGTNNATGSGSRLTYDTRTYLSFGADNRFTLAGRLQGGSIIGPDVTKVPNEYRFYSGGGGTVRGHEYQALDITLPNGVASGGASYVAASIEARFGITEKIGGVAFYDFGAVSAEAFPDGDNTHSGAGLGVRYDTPIGPIRLDVAAPVSGDGDGFQVYVGIGQAF